MNHSAATAPLGLGSCRRSPWHVFTVLLGYCDNRCCDKLINVTVFCQQKRSKMAILYCKITGYCEICILLQFSLAPTVSYYPIGSVLHRWGPLFFMAFKGTEERRLPPRLRMCKIQTRHFSEFPSEESASKVRVLSHLCAK